MTHESYIYKKGEETSEKSEELEDKTKARTREEEEAIRCQGEKQLLIIDDDRVSTNICQ